MKREKKKRAIFDGMGPKRRQKILKKMGYEKWDPFQEPRDPIDLRDHKAEQIASVLVRQVALDCEIKITATNPYRRLKTWVKA